jgi:hypothetical protein
MRRRSVVMLAFLLIAPVVLFGGAAQFGSAHPAHRDLLINRTLTEFSSGDFAGDQVTIFGSGAWNTVTGAVQAGGMLLHRTANGSVVARAPWRATGVESFDSFGGDGFVEGGVLVLDVRIYASGGPVDVNDFTIVCLVGSPPPGAVESVTIESIGLDEPIQSPHRFTLFFQGTNTAP